MKKFVWDIYPSDFPAYTFILIITCAINFYFNKKDILILNEK